MEKLTLSESNFELWLLLGRVRHSMFLARQKELSQYSIPVRHAYILRTIEALGSMATISSVAKQVERKITVISRQTASMEKDGLIKRIKDKPKSKLLRLELTEKGLDAAKYSKQSKLLDALLSFLSEKDRQRMKSDLNRILTNLEEYHPD
jgi:DNA-binding MarR family transcriptional regulator